MIIALAALLPAFALGFLTVLLAWPGPYQRDLPLKLALAAGIGPGIVSCLYFLFSVAQRPRSRAYWLVEAACFLVLALAAYLLRRRKSHQACPPASNIAPNWLSHWILAAAVLIGLIAAGSFAVQSLMMPHGIQDAWNIWNMRARFLFRGGPNWTDLFTSAIHKLNHPDYPFLITTGTARGWSLLNVESVSIPIAQAGLYALAVLGLLYAVLSRMRSRGQAALATLLLASTAWFVLFGAWQISDVPLTYFLSTSLFLLILVLHHPSHGLLILLGLSAGLASWTKNEGIYILLIVVAVFFLARLLIRAPLPTLLREAGLLGLGLLLPLACLVVLKLFLAPPSDLFADQNAASLSQRLTDLSRYSQIAIYLWKNITQFGSFTGWNPAAFAMLIVYALAFWPSRPSQYARGLRFASLCLALLAAGYIAIYVITPYDLVWHLRTSANRLVFHFYPSILLLLFWSLSVPEELVAPPRPADHT